MQAVHLVMQHYLGLGLQVCALVPSVWMSAQAIVLTLSLTLTLFRTLRRLDERAARTTCAS